MLYQRCRSQPSWILGGYLYLERASSVSALTKIMKTICTVRNIHLKTVVAMLGAPACEVGAVDTISASDIELAGALITKRNLFCISVRPCHRPHGCGLGEGGGPPE